MKTFFITGIDTGIGKSIVTGLLARYLRLRGVKHITAKMVQTGCRGIAEDIITHRKIEGISLLPEDKAGETCPYVFDFPASPHLAAEMKNQIIAPEKIMKCVDKLSQSCKYVLLEGAGGFMVPLTRNLLSADFVAAQNYSLIVASSGRLGSINHTLLTLETARKRNINIAGVIYNAYPPEKTEISEDSKTIISSWMKSNNIEAPLIELPLVKDLSKPPNVDFKRIFNSFPAKNHDIKIRKIKKSDLEIIAASFHAAGWNRPASQYLNYLKEQQEGRRIVLVAFTQGDFAGYGNIIWTSRYTPFSREGIPEISDLNVLPEFRRKGVATVIMEHAEEMISARSDHAGIGVGLSGDCGAAQKMYVRRGYVPDGAGISYECNPCSKEKEPVLWLTRKIK